MTGHAAHYINKAICWQIIPLKTSTTGPVQVSSIYSTFGCLNKMHCRSGLAMTSIANQLAIVSLLGFLPEALCSGLPPVINPNQAPPTGPVMNWCSTYIYTTR